MRSFLFFTACLRMTVALPLSRRAWMLRWDFSIATALADPRSPLISWRNSAPCWRTVALSRFSIAARFRRRIFRVQESGAVELTEEARKLVLTTWQERKRDEITHPFLEEKTTVGLLPFLQARLLARYLRKDLDTYPAFLWR
jgi:hypothetical protein